MVNMGMMQMQMQQPCQQCGGKGNTMAAKCKKCRGGRLIQETKLLEINVEKGMSDADTILFEKQGEQVPDQARGDLVFSIRQRPHNRFKRVGNNLFMDLTISLEESLLGFRRTITHLDNHQFEVKSSHNEIIQPDQWTVINGKGMPHRDDPSSFGNLHLKMKVVLPKTMTPTQVEQIKQILGTPENEGKKDDL